MNTYDGQILFNHQDGSMTSVDLGFVSQINVKLPVSTWHSIENGSLLQQQGDRQLTSTTTVGTTTTTAS